MTAGADSTASSAFARERKECVLVETDLGPRLEKRGGLGVINVRGEEKDEHLLADRAPPVGWLSTSIFLSCGGMQLFCFFRMKMQGMLYVIYYKHFILFIYKL